MKKENNSDIKTMENILLSLSSLGLGAYLGLCRSKGTQVSNQALLLAPTIAGTIIGAAEGGLTSLIDKNRMQKNHPYMYLKMSENLKDASASAIAKGTLRGYIGAVETAVGYALGFTLGNIAK